MTYTTQMLEIHHASAPDPHTVASAINALNDCAQACMVDIDADLGVSNLSEMVKCIRLCQHCTDVCATTARIISRPVEYDAQVIVPLLEACLAICKACADECEVHARHHEHCRVCAEACRDCESHCRQLLATLK